MPLTQIGCEVIPVILSSVHREETDGSSSGSAISVAANMVAVSLGTETDGSIICPANFNAVVGIKPTVGLTSRAGVIPFSPRQDTVGPICRTISDTVYVLDTIVGFDCNDANTAREASKYIPTMEPHMIVGKLSVINDENPKKSRIDNVLNNNKTKVESEYRNEDTKLGSEDEYEDVAGGDFAGGYAGDIYYGNVGEGYDYNYDYGLEEEY